MKPVSELEGDDLNFWVAIAWNQATGFIPSAGILSFDSTEYVWNHLILAHKISVKWNDYLGAWDALDQNYQHLQTDNDPLVAVKRCYIASVLGTEVNQDAK